MVFFLSIKIHYLLAALALIVGFRRLALALGAALLVICVVAALTLRLGAAWTGDYLDSLSLFLSEQRPAWISASFVQENMILFSYHNNLIEPLALVNVEPGVGISYGKIVRKGAGYLHDGGVYRGYRNRFFVVSTQRN